MHALILAAGQGSRLATGKPKCLVEVARRPLLAHQIEAVRRAGATRVTIVVGHGHEQVRSFAEGEATFVGNDRFAETNSLYSFWLARHAVAGDLNQHRFPKPVPAAFWADSRAADSHFSRVDSSFACKLRPPHDHEVKGAPLDKARLGRLGCSDLSGQATPNSPVTTL